MTKLEYKKKTDVRKYFDRIRQQHDCYRRMKAKRSDAATGYLRRSINLVPQILNATKVIIYHKMVFPLLLGHSKTPFGRATHKLGFKLKRQPIV